MKRTITILAISCLVSLTAWATPIDTVTLGGHTIDLIGVNDFQNGLYVWTYQIHSTGDRDISHWVLDICRDIFVGASEDNYEWVNPDPTIGISGLKFDTGYDSGEVRTIQIYLSSAAELVETAMNVGVKAGRYAYTGTITAPGCCPPAIPEPSTIALVTMGLVGLATRRKLI